MKKSHKELIACSDAERKKRLIQAVKEGDVVATRIFFQQYYVPVNDFSYSILHDEMLAEKHTWDVLKEALIRLRKGADCGDPSSWLRMLTKEVAQWYASI